MGHEISEQTETLSRAMFRILRETRSDYELTEVRSVIISASRGKTRKCLARESIERPNPKACIADKTRYVTIPSNCNKFQRRLPLNRMR